MAFLITFWIRGVLLSLNMDGWDFGKTFVSNWSQWDSFCFERLIKECCLQVAVFCPTRLARYLNITLSNMVKVCVLSGVCNFPSYQWRKSLTTHFYELIEMSHCYVHSKGVLILFNFCDFNFLAGGICWANLKFLLYTSDKHICSY
jgi:hypothetical protein